MIEFLLIAAVALAASDFVLGIVFKRCMIPGLKCSLCREDRHQR